MWSRLTHFQLYLAILTALNKIFLKCIYSALHQHVGGVQFVQFLTNIWQVYVNVPKSLKTWEVKIYFNVNIHVRFLLQILLPMNSGENKYHYGSKSVSILPFNMLLYWNFIVEF